MTQIRRPSNGLTLWLPLPLLLLLLLLSSTARARAPETRFSVADINRLADVSEPALSRDGSAVVYTVTTANLKRDQPQSDLWRVRYDGSERTQLTHTPDSDESLPQWSADGKFIAFLSDRKRDADAGEATTQVWLMPADGGEARPVTNLPSGIKNFVWSPDGKSILALIEQPEVTHLARINLPGGKVTELTHGDRFDVALDVSANGRIVLLGGDDTHPYDLAALDHGRLRPLDDQWANRAAWDRASYPLLHADRITTPTLFQCGERDFNVPCIGAKQMYQALRSLNVPTQLVVYPGQHHEPTLPSYVRDRMQRNLDWYSRFLKPVGPAK